MAGTLWWPLRVSPRTGEQFQVPHTPRTDKCGGRGSRRLVIDLYTVTDICGSGSVSNSLCHCLVRDAGFHHETPALAADRGRTTSQMVDRRHRISVLLFDLWWLLWRGK